MRSTLVAGADVVVHLAFIIMASGGRSGDINLTGSLTALARTARRGRDAASDGRGAAEEAGERDRA